MPYVGNDKHVARILDYATFWQDKFLPISEFSTVLAYMITKTIVFLKTHRIISIPPSSSEGMYAWSPILICLIKHSICFLALGFLVTATQHAFEKLAIRSKRSLVVVGLASTFAGPLLIRFLKHDNFRSNCSTFTDLSLFPLVLHVSSH